MDEDEGFAVPRRSGSKDHSSKMLCSYFVRTGLCKFGESCRYSHDLEKASSERVARIKDTQSERKVRREVCMHFQQFGRCKHGAQCRFIHDRGDPMPSSKKPASGGDPFNIFEILVHRKMANCTSKQIGQFVQTCNECLLLEDDGTKTTVLNILNSGDGVQMLRNMFGNEKSFVLEKANKTQVSLLEDFFPMVQLVSSEALLGTVLQNSVNGFLDSFARCFDWKEVLPLLEEYLTKQKLPSKEGNSAQEYDEKLLEMIQSFVGFLLELIRRFDHDFVLEINQLLPILMKFGDLLLTGAHLSRPQTKLKEAFLELTNFVSQKTGQYEIAARFHQKLKEREQRRKQKAGGISVLVYEEPPGELRNGGPRHDNDHADIQQIRTVPTEQEVLCEIPPYLPQNKAGTVVHLEQGSVNAHRDLHFRLLRHNLVADLHTAITSFVECGGVKGFNKMERGSSKNVGMKQLQDVRTDIYRNARINEITASHISGVSYIVSFSNLDMLKNQGLQSRISYWQRTRRLAHGSLACLCWGLEKKEDKPNLVFGVISERKEGPLSMNRPSVGFRCVPNPYSEKLMALLRSRQSQGRGSEVVLLQAGPSFFAFHPVLEALKNAPIPLRQYITLSSSEQDNNKIIVGRPKYVEEGGTYNLSFLCPKTSTTSIKLRGVRANDPGAFPLNDIVELSTLDPPQAEALKLALTHEVAAIQGPPGTGKTFLGIQIVRALLSFTHESRARGLMTRRTRPALAPILCVCYTNHALDQFLVGLLDAGIKSIVRVGGNSRCEKLEEYNLRNWEKPNLGRTGYELKKKALPALQKLIIAITEPLVNQPDEGNKRKTRKAKGRQWSLDEILAEDNDTESEASSVAEHSLEELLELDELSNINSADARLLRHHLHYLPNKKKQLLLERAMKAYESILERYHELQEHSNLSCLRTSSIVGMTTTYLAKNQKLLSGLKPRVVILEEAAEVLEAHVLACLSSQTEHLILVGDHLQLRPKIDQYMLQAASGTGFDLDISLFERLVTQNNLPFATLETQRRMRPQFSQLIRPTVYPHLIDYANVKKYPKNVPGMCKTLFFFDHDHKEEGSEEGKSHRNAFEAHFAVELAAYIVKQQCFRPEDVAVVTPYVGQLLLIKNIISKTSIPFVIGSTDEELLEHATELKAQRTGVMESEDTPHQRVTEVEKKLNHCLRLATIDNFQGEEAKVVILSLVRNNKQGHIGFLGEKNRINVLLSRAKEGMYILGNAESLINCTKSTMWKQVLTMMKEQNCVGPELEIQCQNHPHVKNRISNWEDFERVAMNGGCHLPCLQQRPCGHVCNRICHIVNRDHAYNDCEVIVSKELPCGHVKIGIPCHEACHPDGVLCFEQVKVQVDGCTFGHKYTIRCHASERFRKDPENCTALVNVDMPKCGHSMQISCCKRQKALENPTYCRAVCGVMLSCGHHCAARCGKCIEKTQKADPKFEMCQEKRNELQHLPCETRCNQLLLCGHKCREPCHKGKECGDCLQSCTIKCSHSSRGCKKKCSELCHPCSKSCDWECSHEGRCPLPCGAPCARLPCDKRCENTLSCGCRCPSLCGEKCPSKDYCLLHGSESVKKMEVDRVLFRSYEELTDDDLTSDPLIVLNCGHAFLTSTLDVHMELQEYYKRDENDEWLEIKVGDRSLQFDARKSCLECESVIVDIHRYGRIINKSAIDLMERNFFLKNEDRLETLNKSFEKVVNKEENKAPTKTLQAVVKQYSKSKAAAENMEKDYSQFLENILNHPTKELFEKAKPQDSTKQKPTAKSLLCLESIHLPRPNHVIPCKAYVDQGVCIKQWISLQTDFLLRLKLSKVSGAKLQQKNLALKETVEGGEKKIHEALDFNDRFTKQAVLSKSSARMVDACNVVLGITLVSLWFTLQADTSNVAKATEMTSQVFGSSLRSLQEKIVDKTNEALAAVLGSCKDAVGRTQLQRLQGLHNQMRLILTRATHSDRMNILKSIKLTEPQFQKNTIHGSLCRCLNGHYSMSEASRKPSNCTECGIRLTGRN